MVYRIINSDVYAGLLKLKSNYIDIAVTSPPYWNQRDYGFVGQIGNEKTYQEYISKLVKIFNLLRDKLTEKGVFFLNIGDKYLSKYGKTPLGFIPYKLAYEMVKDGWILNDIIIWYKPNHMPSSIKNRFTNSYEPIFVFARTENNIFIDKRNKTLNYSNILKIPLQPTPYKHVAVYPEKLVEKLLEKVNLPLRATVLDPFAGSGTTLKVVKDIYKNCNAIMIENNENYISIIKERCNLNGQVKINAYDFIYYLPDYKVTEIEKSKLFEPQEEYSINVDKNGFIKVFKEKKEYYCYLQQFINRNTKSAIGKHAICFLGCKEFDIELIYNTSKLNENGWVVRNMLAVEEDSHWFPIFMIVDDNKQTKYIFNYKNLNLKSKNEYNRNWFKTNFICYKVNDSVSKYKKTGKIVKIYERWDNGFPMYVIVKWDNGTYTKEFVIHSQEQINKNLLITSKNSNFEIKEIRNFISIDKRIDYQETENNFSSTLFDLPSIDNYNGKFKYEKRINWGASPGARASVEEEYFSLQRLYEVNQNIIVDYLNFKRTQKGLSKNELTNLFPKEYKHTVGHWLRKDFGGSLPTPEDWQRLSEILDIDIEMTNYVCKTALKIQTVKHGEFKMPIDYITIGDLNTLKLLINNHLLPK